MVRGSGYHNCKMDSKGRILLPVAFRQQLVLENDNRCVLRKNLFQNCIDLYPLSEWQKRLDVFAEKARRLDPKDASDFMREMTRGSETLTIDASGRLLIPKKLMSLLDLCKEVTLVSQYSRVELWNTDVYDRIAWDDKKLGDLTRELFKGDAATIL